MPRMNWLMVGFLMAGVTVALSGCGQTPEPGAAVTPAAGHDDHDHAGHDHAGHEHGETKEHTHGGWWCDAHGVPEDVCALCNSKVAADFQKKGDWCKEHDRPDSQCFVCHPEMEARFAEQYEAKYGKQPPKPSG